MPQLCIEQSCTYARIRDDTAAQIHSLCQLLNITEDRAIEIIAGLNGCMIISILVIQLAKETVERMAPIEALEASYFLHPDWRRRATDYRCPNLWIVDTISEAWAEGRETIVEYLSQNGD
jgi:hypothetical protein